MLRNTKVLLNIVLTLSEQIMEVMDVKAQIEEKGRVLSQVKIKTNTSLQNVKVCIILKIMLVWRE